MKTKKRYRLTWGLLQKSDLMILNYKSIPCLSKEGLTMMGQRKFNMKSHHNLCLDDLVSPNDLYRKIDGLIDFSFVYELVKESYSHAGQPSLDPVVFFKMEIVGFLEGIHEDRALERRIKDSLSIRWFLGYDLDQAPPFHSTISRTRKDRISKTVYQAVFDHVLGLCIRNQLVKGHHQSLVVSLQSVVFSRGEVMRNLN